MIRFLMEYATNAEGYSREVHIAQIIRLLGPPPSQFMNKCDPHIRNDLFSPQGMLYVISMGCKR